MQREPLEALLDRPDVVDWVTTIGRHLPEDIFAEQIRTLDVVSDQAIAAVELHADLRANSTPLGERDYTGFEPGTHPWVIDAADLLAEPDPGPTPWLVDRLIVDQALVACVGRWKTTKSYALLHLCISIATGRPAFGSFAIPQPGPVIFANEESGRAALWRRLDALARGNAIDREELRGLLMVSANARIKLDDPGWQAELISVGKELRPRLIALDPLARMKAADRDENSQADMGTLVEFVRELRDQTGAAIAFVHHTGHAGAQMRGSSDLESVWESRLTWTRDGQAPLVTLTSEHREAEPGDPAQYRIGWDADTRSMRLDLATSERVAALPERIVDYLRANPKSKAREIAKDIDTRATDVDREIKTLLAAGEIQRGRSGRVDKFNRAIRDEVYSLADGSSQTRLDTTPGTSHGTSHHGSSRPRTSHNAEQAQTQQPSHTVARPTPGTNQDEPPAGHRGSLPRPAPLGADERDEPPDEPPHEKLEWS